MAKYTANCMLCGRPIVDGDTCKKCEAKSQRLEKENAERRQRTVKENENAELCSRCRGTGKDIVSNAICGVCSGLGIVYRWKRTCSSCDGTGRVRGYKCATCNGTGEY